MIDAVFAALAKVVALPQPVLAMLAGTFIAWGVTQRLKFLLPTSWSAKAREVSTQAIAFATGMAATFALFPYSNFPASLFAAFVVGLWSPALWNVLMLVIGWKWPTLRDTLSQNVRTK